MLQILALYIGRLTLTNIADNYEENRLFFHGLLVTWIIMSRYIPD
jgi:hypothetical protein